MRWVLGPVLAHELTATSSLTRKVKPGKLDQAKKMGITTGTINANNGLYIQSVLNIPAVRLCADRVRCQPEEFMVTE